MSAAAVMVKEAIIVTPSEPTPNQVLKLSALDSQLFLRFTVEYLLVYYPLPDLDKLTISGRLKSALSKILVPYYPLAGRVRASTPQSSGNLEVLCQNQGALFIEAFSESTVSEFENAPTNTKQCRELLSFHVSDVLKGAPPLVMQLTWLSDGGATLAVGFNHCLVDGIGSGRFLNSFADLARSRKTGLNDLNPYPVWARHLLNPTPLLGNFSHLLRKRDFSRPLCNQSRTRRNHSEFEKVTDMCDFVSRFTQERLVPTSITLNKRNIYELKQSSTPMNYSNNNIEFRCTSFEVVSAHIWRSWAISLNLPFKQVVKLLFSVNVRNRVKPSLPNGYYGNAFVLGCAQTRVQDLVEKGLSHATELVKRAKEEIDCEYVREVVELVSSGGARPDSVGVLILSQWSRLGLEEIDFGMGKAVDVGPVCCYKYCLLLPLSAHKDKDKDKDGVKVNLAVPTSAVDHYVHLLTSTTLDSVDYVK